MTQTGREKTEKERKEQKILGDTKIAREETRGR